MKPSRRAIRRQGCSGRGGRGLSRPGPAFSRQGSVAAIPDRLTATPGSKPAGQLACLSGAARGRGTAEGIPDCSVAQSSMEPRASGQVHGSAPATDMRSAERAPGPAAGTANPSTSVSGPLVLAAPNRRTGRLTVQPGRPAFARLEGILELPVTRRLTPTGSGAAVK